MATIQGVYVALFGRPADPTGLAYFNSVTKNGADLSAIGDLASTQEYKDRFAGQSNTQIVSSIYQSLFNRAPESAGLTFFVDALNKGTLNVKNIAIAILDGAQGDDKTIATNKITAADNFTKAIDTPVEVGSYQGNTAAQLGRNFLSGITKDTSTIPTSAATDAAIAAIVSTPGGTTPTTGVSINILNATDTVDPNNANPAYKSTSADDTINVADGSKLKSTSVFDAGLGNDTLKITGNVGVAANGAGADAPTLKGIETVSIKVGAAVDLSLSKATGVSSVVVDTTNAAGVKVADVASGVTLTAKNALAGNLEFAVKGADTNATDSLTFKVDTISGAGEVKLAGIETLTVDATGSSVIAKLTDANLQTLKFTGNGNVEITDITASTSLKTIDASASTGTIKLTVSDAGVTYTGSKGIDTIALGGKGDTIVYNASNISTANKTDAFTSFTVAGDDKDKVDLSAFASGIGSRDKSFIGTFTNAAADGDTLSAAVSVYKNGGVSTVYVDTNGDGKFEIGTDLSLKITTVGGADLTKDNFVF